MTKTNTLSALAAVLAAALAAAGCSSDPAEKGGEDCAGCHAGRADGAPADAAHALHLDGGALARPVACAECHPLPSSGDQHRDGDVQVTFGAFARTGGATPSWNGARCSGVYCHGSGGSASSPLWTKVYGTQTACGGCHAQPPSANGHPQVALAYCSGCHASTIKTDGTLVAGSAAHLDGSADVDAFAHPGSWLAGHQPAALADAAVGCMPCHGADLKGGTSGKSCWSCHPTGPPL